MANKLGPPSNNFPQRLGQLETQLTELSTSLDDLVTPPRPALVGKAPGADAGESPRRDPGDESFGPVVPRWRELAVSYPTKKSNGSALLDSSDTLNYEVRAQPFNLDVGLNGQRDPRISSNITQFHVVGEMAGNNLIPLPANVDARHLRGTVRVDGG